MFRHVRGVNCNEKKDDLDFEISLYPPVYPHQFFEIGKASIKGVRGIGDVELGISLVRKKIRHVSSHTSIRRSQPFMGIVPSPCCRVGRSFFEEGGPFVMPGASRAAVKSL